MREILFRGQTEAQKKWIFGDLLHGTCTGLVWIDNHKDGAISDLRVIPSTVGQFTGLTDKNGNKVFEGDIVRRTCGVSVDFDYLVDFKCGEFYLVLLTNKKIEGGKELMISYAKDGEIIGNIHDNPERWGK